MPKAAQMPSISAISFWKPYWELVFRDKLSLGRYAIKTFNTPYRHRGLILCYSGLNWAEGPLYRYGFSSEAAKKLSSVNHIVPSGVVGCALVRDCRVLHQDEKDALFRGYNNIQTLFELDTALKDESSVYAMTYGIFMPMSNVHRFEKPFVPPKQHVFGPRARIPLYPEIEEQLPKWAKESLREAA